MKSLKKRIVKDCNPNQNLSDEEKIVFNFLDKNIEKNWDMFIHPFLNGLKPDFVLVNDNKGIVVIRMKGPGFYKEWEHLRLIRRQIEQVYCPSIWNEEYIDKEISSDLSLYKNYKSPYKPIISLVVASPNQTSNDLTEDLDETSLKSLEPSGQKYHTKLTKEITDSDEINQIISAEKFPKSKYMNKEIGDQMRSWLLPVKEILAGSDYFYSALNPEVLNRDQHLIATTKTASGFRKISGPAGSGKTITLAARSVNTLKEKKKVLFLTYNRSLVPYLRLNIFKVMRHDSEFNNLDFQNEPYLDHFHGLLVKIKKHLDMPPEKRPENIRSPIQDQKKEEEEEKKEIKHYIGLLREIKTNRPKELDPYMFDVILVDEFQDWNKVKFDLAKELLRENGELIVAGDPTQDVYSTNARNWFQEGLEGIGMPGKWRELKASYRVPHEFVPLVDKFLTTFFSKESLNLRPVADDLGDLLRECNYDWYQVKDEESSLNLCIKLIKEDLKKKYNQFKLEDLIILADSNYSGARLLLKLLNSGSYKFSDTFPYSLLNLQNFYNQLQKMDQKVFDNEFWNDDLRMAKRSGFFVTNQKMKASTIESFKGLESNSIIMQIHGKRKNESEEQYFSRIYTGLTRLKMGLNNFCQISVVCCDPMFENYKKSWLTQPLMDEISY